MNESIAILDGQSSHARGCDVVRPINSLADDVAKQVSDSVTVTTVSITLKGWINLMNLHLNINRVAFTMLAGLSTLVLSIVSAGQSATSFHLREGLYVAGGGHCEDTPNAGILVWDGKGLSGAHASKCLTKQLQRQGNSFEIQTTCSALGDGTPTKPDVETDTLVIHSQSSFTLVKRSAGDRGTQRLRYQWSCASM
ncbi:hypothetical protein AciX8_3777 [Granulicella mallensis MP5ACTX8]|uniref:Uncharacterized protein n=2 Tax=Granulicella mallensis TaxID=940614 RepID=G8P0H3_GRAMM|nr:hypothetical protein AciX8_3777 [Granulicella mallensis MP5ACTX8]